MRSAYDVGRRDVERETRRIEANDLPPDTILAVKNIVKVYPGTWQTTAKVALGGVSLHVRDNECFGLLGPNGAGKTTLINILSGTLKESSGAAQIAGFDMTTDRQRVREMLGCCPQHDIVYNELSVRDHVLFFSRLKGIAPSVEREHADELIREVGLESSQRRLAGDLSGGQKRRLSLCIALSGDPAVVFIDEASSGLDPASRRGMWDVLMQVKQRRSIVLTTHSMEEADVLSDRIGIVMRGTMQCIGTPLYLKKLFVDSIKLSFLIRAGCRDNVRVFVRGIVPEASEVPERSTQTELLFIMRKSRIKLAKVIADIEANRVQLGIQDWLVAEADLEDVFLNLVNYAEQTQSTRARAKRPGVV